MITQDESVKAMNLMIDSLSDQQQKFPSDQTFLVSLEIAQHLSDYASSLSGKHKMLSSGDSFEWKGYKCKVA